MLGLSWPLPNSPWWLDLQVEEMLTRLGGKKSNLPLSDKSRSLMELASGMRSWMTWAPADLSLEETARHQYKGEAPSPANEILPSGRSPQPHSRRGTDLPTQGVSPPLQWDPPRLD